MLLRISEDGMACLISKTCLESSFYLSSLRKMKDEMISKYLSYSFSIFLSLFFFVFLGLYLWHMGVPRLGVESEL